MQYILVLLNVGILITIIASAINVHSYRYSLLRKTLLVLFVFNIYIYFAPTSINHFGFIDTDITVASNENFSVMNRYVMTEKDTETLMPFLDDYVMRKTYADSYYGANWVNFEILTDTREYYTVSMNTDNRHVRFRKSGNNDTYVFKARTDFRDYVQTLNLKYFNTTKVEDDLQFKFKIVGDQLTGQFKLENGAELLQILLEQTYKNGHGSGSVSYEKSGDIIIFERYISPDKEAISRQMVIRYAVNNKVFQKTVEID